MKTTAALFFFAFSSLLISSCGTSQQSRICGSPGATIHQTVYGQSGGYGYGDRRPAYGQSSVGPVIRSSCGRYAARVVELNPVRLAPIGQCPPRVLNGMMAHVRRCPPRMVPPPYRGGGGYYPQPYGGYGGYRGYYGGGAYQRYLQYGPDWGPIGRRPIP